MSIHLIRLVIHSSTAIFFHSSCHDFGAFVYGIPSIIIVVFNIIAFVCSCVVVIKLKVQHKKMKASGEQSDQRFSVSTRKACKLFMSLTGILCLLGLPWIAIAGANLFLQGTVVQLLLTVYHSFQGFLLFIFFTAINPELRNQWIKLLRRCWVKKKHSSLPKHKAQSILLNLGEQCSPEANMRETEWITNTYIQCNYQISCFVHNTYYTFITYLYFITNYYQLHEGTSRPNVTLTSRPLDSWILIC